MQTHEPNLLDMDSINAAIERAAKFLKETDYRDKNGYLGWGENPEDSKAKTLEPWAGCAEAIIALVTAGVPVRDRHVAGEDKSPAFFIASELNKGAGVRLYLPRKTEATIPSTAYCVIALSQVVRCNVASPAYHVLSDAIAKGCRWLCCKKLKDGAWSFSENEDEAHTYATTAAIRSLLASVDLIDDEELDSHLKDAVRDGVDWLVRTRNDDLLWGRTASGQTSFVHSAYALITLMDAQASGHLPCEHLEQLSQAVDSSSSRFISRVAEDKDHIIGGLIAYESTETVIRHYHYDLPWIVAALSKVFGWRKEGLLSPKARVWLDLAHRLLEQQEDKAFVPRGYHSKPVWAIHDAVYALTAVRSSITVEDLTELWRRRRNLRYWVWWWVCISAASFLPLAGLLIYWTWYLGHDVLQALAISFVSLLFFLHVYSVYKGRLLETRTPGSVFKAVWGNLWRTLEDRFLGEESER